MLPLSLSLQWSASHVRPVGIRGGCHVPLHGLRSCTQTPPGGRPRWTLHRWRDSQSNAWARSLKINQSCWIHVGCLIDDLFRLICRITRRPWRTGSPKWWPKWAYRRCSRTKAPRSSKPSAWRRRSSINASRWHSLFHESPQKSPNFWKILKNPLENNFFDFRNPEKSWKKLENPEKNPEILKNPLEKL